MSLHIKISCLVEEKMKENSKENLTSRNKKLNFLSFHFPSNLHFKIFFSSSISFLSVKHRVDQVNLIIPKKNNL